MLQPVTTWAKVELLQRGARRTMEQSTRAARQCLWNKQLRMNWMAQKKNLVDPLPQGLLALLEWDGQHNLSLQDAFLCNERLVERTEAQRS